PCPGALPGRSDRASSLDRSYEIRKRPSPSERNKSDLLRGLLDGKAAGGSRSVRAGGRAGPSSHGRATAGAEAETPSPPPAASAPRLLPDLSLQATPPRHRAVLRTRARVLRPV